MDGLCMNCMSEIGSAKQCPYCGYHTDSPQMAPYLPTKTIIGTRYLVGKLRDYNGDGATYMGFDLERKTPVLIREYLPDAISTRRVGDTYLSPLSGCDMLFAQAKSEFTDMWRKIAHLRNASAVFGVLDMLEFNNTVYVVTEYIENVSLREYLLRSQTGYIPWEKARILFMPVLSTLAALHSAGVVHGGISPSTLIVCKDGKLRITGFSIRRVRTSRGEIPAQLFPGYAAIEQYSNGENQGPWTDIYGFAAVLYRALIGSTPLEATSRVSNDRLMVPAKFAEEIPAYVINALINALQILPDDRTKNVEQFRAELSASPMATNSQQAQEMRKPASAVSEYVAEKTASNPDFKKNAIIAFLAVLLVGLIALGIFYVVNQNKNKPKVEEPSASASQEMVEVPDFVGASYQRLENESSFKERFNINFVEEFSSEVEAGYVISQDVEKGTMVEKGSTINIVVSKGVEYVDLPDLKGLPYDDVKQRLESLGFECRKVEKSNDGSHIEGEVVSFVPEAGKQYAKGEQIYVQVWGAPPTTQAPSESSDSNQN
ncbi:MAG: PASTA domain-containing protein [Clostridiales bacterium]|nr:PASTA domain-containing protein [Clostridiales bacterium]